MAIVQSQIVGARESSILFVVTGLIAEVLFPLSFIYSSVQQGEHNR